MISNAAYAPYEPCFAETVLPVSEREEQWKRIVDATVDQDLCRVFKCKEDHWDWVAMALGDGGMELPDGQIVMIASITGDTQALGYACVAESQEPSTPSLTGTTTQIIAERERALKTFKGGQWSESLFFFEMRIVGYQDPDEDKLSRLGMEGALLERLKEPDSMIKVMLDKS